MHVHEHEPVHGGGPEDAGEPGSDPVAPATQAKTPLDLGEFRAGFSHDEKRLAHLSRATGSPVLLFTVVGILEGRRITDFLLLEPADRERALRLLESGGYTDARAKCPAGKSLTLTATEGVWQVEVGEGETVAPGRLGKHFQSALQSIAEVRPKLRGCSPRGGWAAYELRGAADDPAELPRAVVAISFEPAPVPAPPDAGLPLPPP